LLCRDPSLPINRNEITRFPHAVLEVKLSLGQGQESPAWVQVRDRLLKPEV
jgi:SPX domain protein involved in polyphosphate accumulation